MTADLGRALVAPGRSGASWVVVVNPSRGMGRRVVLVVESSPMISVEWPLMYVMLSGFAMALTAQTLVGAIEPLGGGRRVVVGAGDRIGALRLRE